MPKSDLKIKIDSEVKKNAAAVLQNLGFTEAEAIELFFKNVVTTKALSFAAAAPAQKPDTAQKANAPEYQGVIPKLDASWSDWLEKCLERGCSRTELAELLLQNNFTLSAVEEAMGAEYPYKNGKAPAVAAVAAKVPNTDPAVDYVKLSKVRLTKTKISGAVKVETDKLQAYTLDNFMTDAECDKMMALMNKQLRPSEVNKVEGYDNYRTSSTSDLGYMMDPFIREIDQRIADVLGINLSYSEGIQAQKYEPGQYFKKHRDFFVMGSKTYEEHGFKMGNRTWTFMVYLNETQKGGGTEFPNIDKIFYPKKGRALVWNNLLPNGEPNYDTLHAGMPVEEGEKYIITKWFREKGKGSMFPKKS